MRQGDVALRQLNATECFSKDLNKWPHNESTELKLSADGNNGLNPQIVHIFKMDNLDRDVMRIVKVLANYDIP